MSIVMKLMKRKMPGNSNHINPAARRGLLDTLDRALERAEYWALAFGVLTMAGLGMANVIARNLFASSLAFSKEVNEASIIFVTFAGLGYAARAGRHIRMTALYDQLPAGARKGLMVLMGVTTALLLLVLAYYATIYAWDTYTSGRVTPALQMPLFAMYLIVPVGLAAGGVQYLLAALRDFMTFIRATPWVR